MKKYSLFILALLLLPNFILASGNVRAVVKVEDGRVAIMPEGAERSFEVTGTFSLYTGDHVKATGGSIVTIVVPPSGPEEKLVPGKTYVVGQKSIKAIGESGTFLKLPAPKRDEKTLPEKVTALAGTVTPIGGEVHIREKDWKSWVRVPHRSSFSQGASIEGSPMSRLQIKTTNELLIRAIGPVSFTMDNGLVRLHRGTILVQVGNDSRHVSLETDVARINLTGQVMEVTHHPKALETTVRLYSGVVKLASPLAKPGPSWSTMMSANRETVIIGGAPPKKPRRFDKRKALDRFIEGWKPEGPGAAFLPNHSDDDLLRQLRADQEPLKRPQPARGSRKEKKSNANWVRLRLRAMESPAKRRHYMAFRRYTEARQAREAYEREIDDENIVTQTEGDPKAKGHIPGGPSPKKEKANLRILRWRERRLASLLHNVETEILNQDQEKYVNPRRILDSLKVSTRERIFGEDLRLQTRRLIGERRLTLQQSGTRVADINAQITVLSGVPGTEAQIRALQAERAQLLREADLLKDSLEELIELH